MANVNVGFLNDAFPSVAAWMETNALAVVNHMPPGGHRSRSAYDTGFIPPGSHWGPSGRLGLLAIAVEMGFRSPRAIGRQVGGMMLILFPALPITGKALSRWRSLGSDPWVGQVGAQFLADQVLEP
jgi:hypothetical protein